MYTACYSFVAVLAIARDTNTVNTWWHVRSFKVWVRVNRFVSIRGSAFSAAIYTLSWKQTPKTTEEALDW